jgi:poly-gamma-glutamate synthesis protein (capsule biosynthesis protein)
VADYGSSAFLDMLSRLEGESVGYVGGGRNESEAYLPLYVDIKGRRIAILSFSNIEIPWFTAANEKAGIAWFNDEKVVEMLRIARENSDYTVVMAHWGTEYTSVLQDEQVRLAHLLVDNGADLVIGGHPHHIQSIEDYNGGRIYYSLGNYIFDGPGTHSGWYDGILVEVHIDLDSIIPTFTEHKYKLDNKGLATLVE